MVNLAITVTKGPNGEIMVYGNYKTGNRPVTIERVNIAEMDNTGNCVFTSTNHVSMTFDPCPGQACLLVSRPPSGTNIKSAKATVYYLEVTGMAQSPVSQL